MEKKELKQTGDYLIRAFKKEIVQLLQKEIKNRKNNPKITFEVGSNRQQLQEIKKNIENEITQIKEIDYKISELNVDMNQLSVFQKKKKAIKQQLQILENEKQQLEEDFIKNHDVRFQDAGIRLKEIQNKQELPV